MARELTEEELRALVKRPRMITRAETVDLAKRALRLIDSEREREAEIAEEIEERQRTALDFMAVLYRLSKHEHVPKGAALRPWLDALGAGREPCADLEKQCEQCSLLLARDEVWRKGPLEGGERAVVTSEHGSMVGRVVERITLASGDFEYVIETSSGTRVTQIPEARIERARPLCAACVKLGEHVCCRACNEPTDAEARAEIARGDLERSKRESAEGNE